VRAEGLLDASGYPRLAASFGGGGTPQFYMGTFPAFLAAWGPVDMGFGSGQGVKCYHSEHLYGEFWHRAFIVAADTPSCATSSPAAPTSRPRAASWASGAMPTRACAA
jgi:phenylacetyl-CoA:acceptor oxidoreductase